MVRSYAIYNKQNLGNVLCCLALAYMSEVIILVSVISLYQSEDYGITQISVKHKLYMPNLKQPTFVKLYANESLKRVN